MFCFILTDGWNNLNIALTKRDDVWCWDNNEADPLTYNDQWMATPNGDGVCGNFFTWGDVFGFNDHSCEDLIGYICEDIHCYLL